MPVNFVDGDSLGENTPNGLSKVLFFHEEAVLGVDESRRIQSIYTELNAEGVDTFMVEDFFKDPDFYNSFCVSRTDEELKSYMGNTAKFRKLISSDKKREILGEEVTISTSEGENGNQRRAESGPKILIEKIPEDIDRSQVLMFRTTQPGGPKPEYYWTSDYFETRRGLSAEIKNHARKTSVTLISSLESINSNGGLIKDINDDYGLSVRQISLTSFSQENTLAIITAQAPSSHRE